MDQLDIRRVKEALADASPLSVRVGYQGVEFVSVADLWARQVGYSYHSDGASLIGEAPGDWRGSWVVIGEELLCGDPVFVDSASPELPVYTAAHGMGAWEPTLVGRSFGEFLRALAAVERLSAGRGCPADLERNPLSQAEKLEMDRLIRSMGLDEAGAHFWLEWFAVA